MEPLTTSLTVVELVSGALGVAAIIGGIIMKAFVNPIKDDVAGLKGTIKGELEELKESDLDKETRLRVVENKTTEHDVHIGQLITTSERLLTKMDELISSVLSKG